MSSKYWFASAFGGGFAINNGNEEIAITPSQHVALKITEALNAMDSASHAQTQKFEVMNRVKEWRVRRDLTQAQLGDLIGVSQGTIARYETSKLALDLEILERLSNALQVEPQLLISHGE